MLRMITGNSSSHIISQPEATHFAAERRQHMTPTEMQEKAMQIFGQGMH